MKDFINLLLQTFDKLIPKIHTTQFVGAIDFFGNISTISLTKLYIYNLSSVSSKGYIENYSVKCFWSEWCGQKEHKRISPKLMDYVIKKLHNPEIVIGKKKSKNIELYKILWKCNVYKINLISHIYTKIPYLSDFNKPPNKYKYKSLKSFDPKNFTFVDLDFNYNQNNTIDTKLNFNKYFTGNLLNEINKLNNK